MRKMIFLILMGVCLAGTISCSKKSGCPAAESLAPQKNKSGEFVSKSGHKSQLFPSKIQKKLKH
jgi:hypothetical protein